MSSMSFLQAGTSGSSAARARFHGPASFPPSLDDELDDEPGAKRLSDGYMRDW